MNTVEAITAAIAKLPPAPGTSSGSDVAQG